MNRDHLFEEFRQAFRNRKFVAGLLVALIDFLDDLGCPNGSINGFAEVIEKFPQVHTVSGGGKANTLIVRKGDGTVSLRRHYNQIESYFRDTEKRFDYPSCAPHATQAWSDYKHWLDALCSLTRKDVQWIREQVIAFVLDAFPNQAQPDVQNAEPPIFRLLLENFELTAQKGEPTGAAYQGIVFGFLRADNPHLQVEIDKVRTGSKRLQRVGDIDGWDGGRLAISAEVKQYVIKQTHLSGLSAFASAVNRQQALGIVATLGFDDGTRESLIEMGLKPLDREDIVAVVELWDSLKQRTAVASFEYYVRHVEKNSGLSGRLKSFLDSANHEKSFSQAEHRSTASID